MGKLGFPRILRSARRLPGRMAGASRRCIGESGPRVAAGFCSGRPACPLLLANAFRRGLALVLSLGFLGSAQAEVLAARIWPAPEYTRLTLETKEALKYT